MNLARWLRRTPVPHALQCGAVKVQIGDGHRRWADAVEAVMATDSETIVALDKAGSQLRVCQRADVDDLPEEPADASYTDKQKELAQIAQIISDAYAAGHEHAATATARGYELLGKMTELAYARLAGIERAYTKLLEAHAQMMLNQEPEKDDIESAIGNMLQSTGVVPKPNGKQTKPETKSEPREPAQ